MWLENVDKFILGNLTDTKAMFWSAHDQNVADLLVAINNFNTPNLPPYNSALILELHEIKGQYYVKVILMDYSNDLLIKRSINDTI